MVKRRREETEPETLYNTVFVDTNLDTHLALIVSYSDYVSDLKGANVAKHEDAGAKHKVKSNFLGQDITIDMILRSSSRFKKAKVMAAQCQDEESQPVDVVPDSLADTWNQ